MDVLRMVATEIPRVSATVDTVRTEQWAAATPCTEWSVRDLLNHLTSEHLWAPHLLRGETLEQVGDRYDGDVLGDDPAGAWHRAADTSRAAWQDAPAGTTVHLSFGPTPVEEYGEQMFTDLVVHGWDLARAIGARTDIDPDSAEHALRYIEPHLGQWPGAFADPVSTDSDDPADRMIAMFGRNPAWRP